MKIKTEFGLGFRKFVIQTPDHTPIFKGYTFDVGFFAIGFHIFYNADSPGFFHTHPGWAWRLILKGGYVEEVARENPDGWIGGRPQLSFFKRNWFPGRFGIVSPDYEHRIDSLAGESSLSLWIRGPVVARVRTRYIPDEG